MVDTLKLERPWIGPTLRRVGVDSNKRIKSVVWTFRNGGRSPAINMRWHLIFMIGPQFGGEYPKATPCEKELPGTNGGVVVPNGDGEYPIDLGPQVRARLDDVYIDGKVRLFLVGCIDYSDTSRKPWYRTNVLEVLDPNPTGGTMAVLDTGNDAW